MLPEQQLRAYVDYLRDLGIHDLYLRIDPQILLANRSPEQRTRESSGPNMDDADGFTESILPYPQSGRNSPAIPDGAQSFSSNVKTQESIRRNSPPRAIQVSSAEAIPSIDRASALQVLRGVIGECTRCPLAYAGRHNIVFGDGDPNARLMFVGEGPGADEDETGLPFVGKAGQLLNNMIAAMGLRRDQVYIANIVKCRPPGNRVPESVEATTCSQFLERQIEIVRPEVIVALGATAATYLLGTRQSLATLRGQWHTLGSLSVAVTYHPAFLLRDPRQKGEAWKDLQRVMEQLGLTIPRRTS